MEGQGVQQMPTDEAGGGTRVPSRGVGCLDARRQVPALSFSVPFIMRLLYLPNSFLLKGRLFPLKSNPDSRCDQSGEGVVSLSLSGLTRLSWGVTPPLPHPRFPLLCGVQAGGQGWPEAGPVPVKCLGGVYPVQSGVRGSLPARRGDPRWLPLSMWQGDLSVVRATPARWTSPGPRWVGACPACLCPLWPLRAGYDFLF